MFLENTKDHNNQGKREIGRAISDKHAPSSEQNHVSCRRTSAAIEAQIKSDTIFDASNSSQSTVSSTSSMMHII